MHVDANYIKSTIRTVPDWPEKGVMFRDITPLFQNPLALRGTLDAFIQRYLDKDVSVVAGIDARGFLLGVTIAYQLNLPFVPIRKQGKLPFKTVSEDYELEYGSATIEINEDAIKSGDKVVIIDDLIATGGTMLAGISLIKKTGRLRHGSRGDYRSARTQGLEKNRGRGRARVHHHGLPGTLRSATSLTPHNVYRANDTSPLVRRGRDAHAFFRGGGSRRAFALSFL